MYLTIKQHDLFRTLLMGFEIPFRTYIAKIITSAYSSPVDFETAMVAKRHHITPSSPVFLKDVLPKACNDNSLKSNYQRFVVAKSSTDEIVAQDIDIPMVGSLNLVTFALTEHFGALYGLFGSYASYCARAEQYRYARNKLDHPGCRTLEDVHLVPVLSFVKDICLFLDDSCFLQKSREQLLTEVLALQQRKINIPVKINNFNEMPCGDARIVCRDKEIQRIKDFVYGKPEDLRKQHSFCIYGYGGVGKTALVLETLKQIVRDVQDQTATNEYSPEYILFYSAKKRKLEVAEETGKFIEKQLRSHFETADELIALILADLSIDSLRKYKKEGIIVVDNLETLTIEERQKVKAFIDTQTPADMQFILTSRNSEEYDANYKLAGFDSKDGMSFIQIYCEENSLDLELSDDDRAELIALAKGNTLVLVLSLRRLSKRLSSIGTLKTEFSSHNAWKSLKRSLAQTPPNAYEVVGEFMYKDTFEHIEDTFAEKAELFYKVLKVFAIMQNDSTDISTICMMTEESYPDVETIMDVLCNFLILEKKDMQYSLNSFAEKYIVGRFIPDAETYSRLSQAIVVRQRKVQNDLAQLRTDMQNRPNLAKIINDWSIITDIDRLTAAKMYRLYGIVRRDCESASKFQTTSMFENFVKECNEAERVTAHPFVKYQKARILQKIDSSNVLSDKHVDEIKRCFSDCIYSINMIEQYAGIQQTRSYASLLWLYGQYLSDVSDLSGAMRYLEEGKMTFEELKDESQEYYQCSTKLGHMYVDFYTQDTDDRLVYLRKARTIDRMLRDNQAYLGKARGYAATLHSRLQQFGQY